MQTQYVPLGQTVQIGDLKPAILYGTNPPSSYSQTTRDPVNSPATGDYIAFPMGGVETLSKTYRVEFYPSAVGVIRAGAQNLPGALQVAGWTARWFVVSTGAEVGNGVNLSTEVVQFGALMTEL
jgi:hypothetical protein